MTWLMGLGGWVVLNAVGALVLHIRGRRKLARARARLEDLAGKQRVGL